MLELLGCPMPAEHCGLAGEIEPLDSGLPDSFEEESSVSDERATSEQSEHGPEGVVTPRDPGAYVLGIQLGRSVHDGIEQSDTSSVGDVSSGESLDNGTVLGHSVLPGDVELAPYLSGLGAGEDREPGSGRAVSVRDLVGYRRHLDGIKVPSEREGTCPGGVDPQHAVVEAVVNAHVVDE